MTTINNNTDNPQWHSRGYLPHFDSSVHLQSITFRLADSLPQTKLEQLQEELEHLPEDQRDTERRKKIESWLDAGMGCCALRNHKMASVVQSALLKFDTTRYRLISWCIMPNHVHVLIKPEALLQRIVQSWKSYTGRWAIAHNAELELGVPRGCHTFWMREYWDRYIRDDAHYRRTVEYIHMNPVKAGLCEMKKQWRWSSAFGDEYA